MRDLRKIIQITIVQDWQTVFPVVEITQRLETPVEGNDSYPT